MLIWTKAGLFAILSLVPALAVAQMRTSIEGFISQGFVASDSISLYDSEANDSLRLTEAAIRGGIQTDSAIRFSGQIMYRNSGDNFEEGLRIDHALMDYTALQKNHYSAGVRLGRIKPLIGFSNESRDVPWTRSTIFLSQSIYSEVLRDTYASADGIGAYQNWYFEDSSLHVDLAWGYPDFDDSGIKNYWGDGAEGDVDVQSSFNVNVRYMLGRNWALNWTWADTGVDFDADADSMITSGSFDYTLQMYSVQYVTENWEWTLDYFLADIEDTGHLPAELANNPLAQPSLPEKFEQTEEKFSLQARYHFAPQWTATLRLDHQYNDKSDRGGGDYAKATAQLADLSAKVNQGTSTLLPQPDYNVFAKAWTLGVEWRPSKRWLVRAESSWGEGLAWVPPLINFGDQGHNSKHWAIYAAQVAYRF